MNLKKWFVNVCPACNATLKPTGGMKEVLKGAQGTCQACKKPYIWVREWPKTIAFGVIGGILAMVAVALTSGRATGPIGIGVGLAVGFMSGRTAKAVLESTPAGDTPADAATDDSAQK